MLDIDSLAKNALAKSKRMANGIVSGVRDSMGISSKQAVAAIKKAAAPQATMGMEETETFHWAGMTRKEFTGVYKQLYKAGIQHKNFYLISMTPYKNNDTRLLELFDFKLFPFLATEANFPILQLQTDSKQIGHFTSNHITGSQAQDISVTFIETKENHVLNSLKEYRKLVCHNDGTQGLPADYALWLSVWLYNRDEGFREPKFYERILCAPTQASLDGLSGEDGSALTIPVSFTPLRPFMPD